MKRLVSHLWRSVFILMPLCAMMATGSPAEAQPVQRKGVTLAGDLNYFINNNFANLQAVLNTRAGTIGVNLFWNEATQPCAGCAAVRPANPRDWKDATYNGSPTIAALDKISDYIRRNGNGVTLMVITFGTPGWAQCPGDPQGDLTYPPRNAADYGDFMYAMSERYNGTHGNGFGLTMGKVRDWIVYNEVNSPSWWHNTACNTTGADQVFYYGGVLNQAYAAVHHVADTRVLAGAFTSYDRVNYLGAAGTRIQPTYADWKANTDNNNANSAWVSPIDFVNRMKALNVNFDAIALHPYPPRIYDNPLLAPPAGAVTLQNLDTLLQLLRTNYPSDSNRWHVALTEYFQHSYYGSQSGYDQVSAVACPNYFCAQTSEANLNSYLSTAYSTSGSNKPYVDYLVWGLWENVNPFVGGIVRANGADKTEGLPSGSSVRATFTAINP